MNINYMRTRSSDVALLLVATTNIIVFACIPEPWLALKFAIAVKLIFFGGLFFVPIFIWYRTFFCLFREAIPKPALSLSIFAVKGLWWSVVTASLILYLSIVALLLSVN